MLSTYQMALSDELPGVVVENVASCSSGETAGVHNGDVIVSYEIASREQNINTGLDWLFFVKEQTPKGGTTIMVKRNSTLLPILLSSGDLGIEARPQMPKSILDQYKLALNFTAEKNPHKALVIMDNLLREAERSKKPYLTAWIALKVCDLLKNIKDASLINEYSKTVVTVGSSFQNKETPFIQCLINVSIGDAFLNSNDLHNAYNYYCSAEKIGTQSLNETLIFSATLNRLGKMKALKRDFTSAEKYFNDAKTIIGKIAPDSMNMAKTLSHLGVLSMFQGEFIQAEDYFSRSLKINETFNRNTKDIANIHQKIGAALKEQGQFDKALEHYQQALQIYEHLGYDGMILTDTLISLGALFGESAKFEQAEKFLLRAHSILEKHASDMQLANCKDNLGLVKKNLGKFDEAEKYFKSALAINLDIDPNSSGVASNLNNLGALAKDEGNIDAAIDFFTKSLTICESIAPESKSVATRKTNLGVLLCNKGELSLCETQYKEAAAILERKAPESIERVINLMALAGLLRQRGKKLFFVACSRSV